MRDGSFRDAGIAGAQAPHVGISFAVRALAVGSALIIWMTAAFVAAASAQPTPRNILLLTSYQSDAFTFHNEVLRTELRRLVPEPLNFLELLVRPAASGQVPDEEPLIGYLKSTVSGQPLDLVVAVGGPAAVFVRTHRERLFPTTPILESSFDVRWLRDQVLSPNETAVPLALDFTGMFEHVLDVLPATRHVVVIIGSSPLETFWRNEFGRESERFAGRLEFVWFDGLSLQEILERSSTLADHSVIFFPVFSVDGAGVAQSQDAVLTQLHARANAPIFGLYDFQVGRGIVGGPLVPIIALAGRAAEVSQRLLRGEAPSTITTEPMHMTSPTYDWRELQRWRISEAGLPPNSTVTFRQPSMWGQYRGYLVAAAVVFALQAALITGLVIQRARRRRTELALRDSERRFRETVERNQDLAGRLISAQEEERSRIARDLHDDLSQQLAGVSMMLSDIDSETGGSAAVHTLQDRVSALARNVRSLSHELHPSVLEHAGLVMTLKRHCAELAHRHRLEIAFSADNEPDALSADAALCLFRVAQEALTNVVRHSGAHALSVQLRSTPGAVEMRIVDDGVGFVVSERTRSGLGLRSIDERVRLANGHVTVESLPGQGTTLTVRIPRAAASDSQ